VVNFKRFIQPFLSLEIPLIRAVRYFLGIMAVYPRILICYGYYSTYTSRRSVSIVIRYCSCIGVFLLGVACGLV